MTDEAREMWQKVLSHQLTGAMFHQEATLTYELLGDCRKEASRHYRQFLGELLNHYKTSELIIREHGEIVRADKVSQLKISVPEITTRPNERLDREKIARDITAKWRNWEKSTVRLYDEAMAAMPNCKWLKLLKCGAEKELKGIN